MDDEQVKDSGPTASVVIAFHEAHDTLGLQLCALADQQGADAFEVLVVDNRSRRSPHAETTPWMAELDLRLVEASAAQGTSYARNVGVTAARTEHIIFCDADDCVGPGFVAAAQDALRHHGLVTGAVMTLPAHAFADGVDLPWKLLAEADPQPAGVVSDGVDHDYPILMGGASAVRRDVFFDLGGFDQAFFPGAEDNDFALRALAAGYGIAHAPRMQLAERARSSARGSFGRSFDAGRMHASLCQRHDLWSTSPHLRHPLWWVDLIKLPAVVIKAYATGADEETKRAVASRVGLRLGQAVGMARYRLARRPVHPQLGVGLGSTASAQ